MTKTAFYPLLALLMLGFSTTAMAATCPGTCVDLQIKHELDNNGVMSVINGNKLKVKWFIDDNSDKLLNKADKIELVTVDGDRVLSSVTRGKGSSGTVSLKVKNSEGEELYVRYRLTKNDEIATEVPDRDLLDYTILASIPGGDLDNLAVRMYALENAPQETYAIGDIGPGGGYVFHTTDGGRHGLEVARNDIGPYPWGCAGSDLPGAERTLTTGGAQNTGDVLSSCMEADIAARRAANYWSNNKNDWFLPSSDELILLLTNLVPQATFGISENTPYLSSTEIGGTPTEVWMVNSSVPDSPQSSAKDVDRLIRPIRAF